MNAVNNSQVGLDFNSYVTFANAQLRKGATKAIARIGGDALSGRKISLCTDGDYVGRIGALRGDVRSEANNEVRNDFLKSVLARCGKTTVADLPESVQKELSLKDFKLDKNGNASSGKPLTARRIKKIDAAIKKAELLAKQDPLSDALMEQTSGSQVCYVNAWINCLKQSLKGKAYLQSIFTKTGCVLFDKPLSTAPSNATTFKYSDYRNRNDRFTLLERVIRDHEKNAQKAKNSRIDFGSQLYSGGTPSMGAEYLGIASKTLSSLKDNTSDEGGRLKCIKKKLEEGNMVTLMGPGHVIGIVGVVEDGGEEKLKVVDDAPPSGEGTIRLMNANELLSKTSATAISFAPIPEPFEGLKG